MSHFYVTHPSLMSILLIHWIIVSCDELTKDQRKLLISLVLSRLLLYSLIAFYLCNEILWLCYNSQIKQRMM